MKDIKLLKQEGDLLAEKVIQMTEDDATDIITQSGFWCRIVQRDDISFALIMDLRFDRINITVLNGMVTKAEVF